MDAARLSTTKSILRNYADSQRGLLLKALQHADELCKMVDQIEPEADCGAFLASAEVSESELVEQVTDTSGEGEASDEGARNARNVGAASSAVSTLGVWIPDDAVRNCNRCQQGFSLLRR